MLIAEKTIDYEVIHQLSNKPSSIVTYIESLVPRWASHIEGITDNQRFYAAIHIRKMLTIPYPIRNAIVEALVKDICINGVVYDFVTINDLIEMCNKELLACMIEEQLKKDVKV